MQRLDLAELRSADGAARHFFSFDGKHFVEVERRVDPRDPEDVKRARFIWRPRWSAGLASMSVITADRTCRAERVRVVLELFGLIRPACDPD